MSDQAAADRKLWAGIKRALSVAEVAINERWGFEARCPHVCADCREKANVLESGQQEAPSPRYIGRR